MGRAPGRMLRATYNQKNYQTQQQPNPPKARENTWTFNTILQRVCNNQQCRRASTSWMKFKWSYNENYMKYSMTNGFNKLKFYAKQPQKRDNLMWGQQNILQQIWSRFANDTRCNADSEHQTEIHLKQSSFISNTTITHIDWQHQCQQKTKPVDKSLKVCEVRNRQHEW